MHCSDPVQAICHRTHTRSSIPHAENPGLTCWFLKNDKYRAILGQMLHIPLYFPTLSDPTQTSQLWKSWGGSRDSLPSREGQDSLLSREYRDSLPIPTTPDCGWAAGTPCQIPDSWTVKEGNLLTLESERDSESGRGKLSRVVGPGQVRGGQETGWVRGSSTIPGAIKSPLVTPNQYKFRTSPNLGMKSHSWPLELSTRPHWGGILCTIMSINNSW